jgi:uncharacterized protein YjaG (DUF416 family)
MTEVMLEQESLKSNLQSHIMTVVFEKSDGSLRQMRCTLLEDYLPEYITESSKKENEDVLVVWDIDNNNWRSFRLDSIRSISYS